MMVRCMVGWILDLGGASRPEFDRIQALSPQMSMQLSRAVVRRSNSLRLDTHDVHRICSLIHRLASGGRSPAASNGPAATRARPGEDSRGKLGRVATLPRSWATQVGRNAPFHTRFFPQSIEKRRQPDRASLSLPRRRVSEQPWAVTCLLRIQYRDDETTRLVLDRFPFSSSREDLNVCVSATKKSTDWLDRHVYLCFPFQGSSVSLFALRARGLALPGFTFFGQHI